MGWAARISLEWRARIGAAAAHALVFAIVLTWPISPEAPPLGPVQVVLVELAPTVTEVPPPPPPLDDPDEADIDQAPPESIEPSPDDPELDVAPDTPPELEIADAPAVEAFTAPPIAVAEPDNDEALTEEVEPVVVDPRWEIPFDPFQEATPSALSRVARAMACSRTNLETRPDFCPNYTDEDLYLSSLSQSRPGSRDYDPIADIAAAEDAVQRAAFGRSRTRRFRERQARATSTSSAEVGGTFAQVPRHPEGLQNCTPVQTGLDGPGGQVSGLTFDDRLGSSDGILCR